MKEETLQESGRLQTLALEEFKILRSAPRKDFDEITFIAKQIAQTPVAVLDICDSEGIFTLSSSDLSKELTPFSGTFLPVLKSVKILYKEDFNSRYFKEIPILGEFIFYAGLPLITAEGNVLGALIVLDHKQRNLTTEQETALTILGNQIIKLLDYRKQHNELKNVQLKLRQKYNDLEKFASVVSHDIKSPLANIISLTEFLKDENRETFNEETKQYLDFLTQSSYSLRNYVDGILTFYRSDNILEKEKENVDLPKLLKGIAHLYQVNSEVVITYPTDGILHNVNKAALTQIFLNLISNALKYNSKKVREVAISFKEEEKYYLFQVKDNGNGIPKKDFEKIFDLFATLDHNDRDGHPGSGIGLATVKKMLDHMEGSIDLESAIDQGTVFKFKIKRK